MKIKESRRVRRGGPSGLTSMQENTLRRLLLGMNTEQIAERSLISPSTVRGHIWRLCQLYAARDRTQLVRIVQERRIERLEWAIDRAMEQTGHCNCRCCAAVYETLESVQPEGDETHG